MASLVETLGLQLSEIEMLQSMFPSSKELQLQDPLSIQDVENYINGTDPRLPAEIEFNIQLNVEPNVLLDLFVKLPHSYPSTRPVVLVRCERLNKTQDEKLNSALRDFVSSIEPDSLCIGLVIDWLKETSGVYFSATEKATPALKTQTNTNNCRLWIYSHHIYNKTKRKNIIDWAEELQLTGFSAPGKPGIICVEGEERNCTEWWQRVRSLNWQRIVCKLKESSTEKDSTSWNKFSQFKEVTFITGSSSKTSDMGALLRFLEEHNCEYVFKEYFGFEGK